MATHDRSDAGAGAMQTFGFGERLRLGGVRVALLAAAGIFLGCGGGEDRAAAVPDAAQPAAESAAAAPQTPPEPIADPVEAFVDLAREAGEDERTLAIARCTITQVLQYNGKDAADTLVRVKRAQMANQPTDPKEIPVLAIMLQEAEDCAKRHEAAAGNAGAAAGESDGDAAVPGAEGGQG